MRSEQKSKPWLPDKWDRQADVVVIGYGGAGSVAAVTAFDAGASVIVLEKSPSLTSLGIPRGKRAMTRVSGGGGNTHIASGMTVSPTNPADAANYLYAACGGATPMDVCQAWAEEVCKNEAWFKEMGIKIKWLEGWRSEYPSLPGWDAMTLFAPQGMMGVFFFKMDEHVQKRGIEVMFDTPGKELIQDSETKEIIGVIAKRQDKEITIKAKKGVVLCTGGFEFNEEMKNRFLKVWPMKFEGWKYNTGDGIKMAQKVGADLWHMDVVAGGHCSWFGDPEYDFGIGTDIFTDNYVRVDKFGSRYINEKKPGGAGAHGGSAYFLERNTQYPGFSRVPSYFIFDETARLAGPIGSLKIFSNKRDGIKEGWMPHPRVYLPPELGGYEGWSQDNTREIERGWISKGNNIEELAATIGEEMDAARLKATIEVYNRYCVAGNDPEFGRPPETLLPVETPPFYAVPLYPGLVCTCGGPMRSARAEVLNPDKKPIPRLYAAGNCGSVYGGVYSVTGGNFGDLCAFGRIAGRNSAALKTWD